MSILFSRVGQLTYARIETDKPPCSVCASKSHKLGICPDLNKNALESGLDWHGCKMDFDDSGKRIVGGITWKLVG